MTPKQYWQENGDLVMYAEKVKQWHHDRNLIEDQTIRHSLPNSYKRLVNSQTTSVKVVIFVTTLVTSWWC